MLPWARKKRKPTAPAHGEGAAHGGEWDFLRDQPDHDADLMAGVRSDATPRLPPSAEAPPVAARPTTAAPRPTAAPQAAAPQRRRSASYSRPSGSTTRPLTVLNDLCARFQEDQEVRGSRPQRYEFAPPAWVLTLRIETDRGAVQRSVHQEVTLGRRDAESGWAPDITLPDDSVSRRHARIYRRGGRFWLQDLDSKNGTRHNGEWLAPGGEVMLLEGDLIALGETCRVRLLDPTFERDEEGLRGFALWALTESIDAERGSAARAPAPPPAPGGGDLLDLALQRGSEVGLLADAGR